MKKNVLGIKVDDISIPEIVETVERWLKKGGKHYIVTPNPEIVMMAQEDQDLKETINKADLAIPDGTGLRLSGDIECISPGIDVLEALVKMCAKNGFTTGFLGGRNEVAEEAAERLIEKYPGLKVSFADGGGEVNKQGEWSSGSDFAIPSTDILFVAFGPPKQEKWIAKNLDRIPVKVAMVVGGTFDILSGKIPRAPKWMRRLELEWLFRLIIQPWRIKRQLALLKYLWLLFNK